eukprot:CAMPEP_0114525038 /NCGR_PEP_ID=MMETSP0109-20121206/22193_1 /TAXON_ID=29199 /ORGANISM="Chlorarachnion reptans, Strain CCCM449" /LENGTH=229 /DNA_ID=CAMNT_0001706557 /DNA_START=12 /DNA_END=697 /DNA_ORIENTATION=+
MALVSEMTPLMKQMTQYESDINAKLELLGSLTGKLKAQGKHIGTSTDNSRFRSKLENTRLKAMKVFQELKRMFKNTSGGGPVMLQLKDRYLKDIAEFIDVTQSLDRKARVVSQGRREAKSGIHRRRKPGHTMVQKQVEIEVLETHDIDAMQTRNQEIRKMEADVVELSHVFTDVLDLTKDQQPNIEQIDHYVGSTRYKVEDARSELEKAELSQRANSRNKCICMFSAAA